MGDLLEFKKPEPEKDPIAFHCLECDEEWEDKTYNSECPECDEFLQVEIIRRSL